MDVDRVRPDFEVCRVERGNWDVVELRLREFVLTENGHQQLEPDHVPAEVWTKPLDVLVPDDVVLPL